MGWKTKGEGLSKKGKGNVEKGEGTPGQKGAKNKGKGEVVEVFGWGTAEVNDKLQLCECKVYYDQNKFLEVM